MIMRSIWDHIEKYFDLKASNPGTRKSLVSWMWGPSWKALNIVGLLYKLRLTSKAIIIPSLPICFCFRIKPSSRLEMHQAWSNSPRSQTDLIHKVGNLITSLGSENTWGMIPANVKTEKKLPNRIKNNSKYSNYLSIWWAFFRFIRVRSVVVEVLLIHL